MYSLKNDVTTQNNLIKDVFLFITEGHYYTLTSDNIKTVLKYSNIVHDLDYNYASYSTILESKNNSLVKYINNNIEECFYDIFPKTSVNETENTITTILNNTEIAEETKIDYLSQQINKINFSGIETKYWEVAIKSKIIQPTWQNIEKFITNEGTEELSSTIIDFISRNSTELSQQKTERVILEATKNKLFVKLMGSDTLAFDSYKLITNSFNLKFTKIDLSKIEQRRVECLIDSKFIEFDNYHFESITNNFPNLVPNYLIENKFYYISKISEYPISASMAISLLNSGRLILKEKISIIESLPNSIISNNSKLSNQICTILNSANKVIGNWSFILELINYATDLQQKLKIFVRECKESDYDEEIVRAGLTFLGGDYKKIALQKGHRPKLSLTNENKILAEYLLKYKFIKSMSEENGKLRINSRNIV